MPWVQVQDAKTGRPYYYNKSTRETKWEPPAGFEPAAAPAAAPTAPPRRPSAERRASAQGAPAVQEEPSTYVMSLLVKNMSPLRSQRLTPAELAELQHMRDSVPPEVWARWNKLAKAEHQSRRTQRQEVHEQEQQAVARSSARRLSVSDVGPSPTGASDAAAGAPASDWVEAVDQQSGHVYEYNAKTKETRWKVAKPESGEGGEGGEGGEAHRTGALEKGTGGAFKGSSRFPFVKRAGAPPLEPQHGTGAGAGGVDPARAEQRAQVEGLLSELRRLRPEQQAEGLQMLEQFMGEAGQSEVASLEGAVRLLVEMLSTSQLDAAARAAGMLASIGADGEGGCGVDELDEADPDQALQTAERRRWFTEAGGHQRLCSLLQGAAAGVLGSSGQAAAASASAASAAAAAWCDESGAAMLIAGGGGAALCSLAAAGLKEASRDGGVSAQATAVLDAALASLSALLAFAATPLAGTGAGLGGTSAALRQECLAAGLPRALGGLSASRSAGGFAARLRVIGCALLCLLCCAEVGADDPSDDRSRTEVAYFSQQSAHSLLEFADQAAAVDGVPGRQHSKLEAALAAEASLHGWGPAHWIGFLRVVAVASGASGAGSASEVDDPAAAFALVAISSAAVVLPTAADADLRVSLLLSVGVVPLLLLCAGAGATTSGSTATDAARARGQRALLNFSGASSARAAVLGALLLAPTEAEARTAEAEERARAAELRSVEADERAARAEARAAELQQAERSTSTIDGGRGGARVGGGRGGRGGRGGGRSSRRQPPNEADGEDEDTARRRTPPRRPGQPQHGEIYSELLDTSGDADQAQSSEIYDERRHRSELAGASWDQRQGNNSDASDADDDRIPTPIEQLNAAGGEPTEFDYNGDSLAHDSPQKHLQRVVGTEPGDSSAPAPGAAQQPASFKNKLGKLRRKGSITNRPTTAAASRERDIESAVQAPASAPAETMKQKEAQKGNVYGFESEQPLKHGGAGTSGMEGGMGGGGMGGGGMGGGGMGGGGMGGGGMGGGGMGGGGMGSGAMGGGAMGVGGMGGGGMGGGAMGGGAMDGMCEQAPATQLHECSSCGRKFNAKALEKHAKVLSPRYCSVHRVLPFCVR